MKAEIISIGDELLIGQVINTNAARIGELLNLEGVQVSRALSISDDRIAITKTVDEALKNSDITIITGGLGPTRDDITKKVLADYFGCGMISHEPTLRNITEMVERRGRSMNDVLAAQALVPECCEVIMNPNGTAPGMLFTKNEKIVVSLPGVPYEMLAMMQESVIPAIRQRFKLSAIFHHTLLTQGIGESAIAERIEKWEDKLESMGMKLAYLPSVGSVRLRISAFGEDRKQLEKQVIQLAEEVKSLLGEHFYGEEKYGESQPKLENVIADLLTSKKKTIALAESCTGGYLSHLFTSVAGSSNWFNGSVVPYHNKFKHSFLGVKNDVFISAGAVSEECVRQMAEGVKKHFESDYAIAISGIAGPSGGTADKPVGTVWIAWAGKKNIVTEKFVFETDRLRNIQLTAQTAMNKFRVLVGKGEL